MKQEILRIILGINLAATAAVAGPVKLIFDTDLGNDVDDAMALAMIHSLERRGLCELLAVTSTKDHVLSAAHIDAINTFYGRPDIPIGAVRKGVAPELGKFLGQTGRYPHDLKSGANAPEAVSLLRKTLAAQPDGSVTIVQVGFFTNCARLMDSEPDEHSPLSGLDLSVEGVVKVADDGATEFTPRRGGKHRYFKMDSHQTERVREAFVHLVSEPPPSVGAR